MRRAALTIGVIILCGGRAPAAEVALRQRAIEEPWGAAVIQIADLDSDKDYDFVAVTETDLSWFENTGRGKEYAAHVIETTVSPANRVFPADLDGDADLDLVTHAQLWGGEIDWSENQGKGKTWPKHPILGSDVGDDVEALTLSDADGDRDLDLMVAGRGVKLLANQDGKAAKWDSPSEVGGISSDIVAIALADFDGDGDNDVVASDKESREFVYAENTGKSWKARRALQKVDHPAYLPDFVQAIDFDKDGDLDIVGVSSMGEVVLHENQDGKGHLVGKVLVEVDGLVMARAADLDSDGDYDIVTACNTASDGLRWLENEVGRFETQHDVFRDWERPNLLEAVDFDGDGDVDIVSVSNSIDGRRTALWENQRP